MAAFGEGKYAVPVITDPLLSLFRRKPTVDAVTAAMPPPDTILLETPVKTVIFDHILHNKELGLAPYCESVLLSGSCTDVREPRKIKRFRLSISSLGLVDRCEPAKLQKTGLLMFAERKWLLNGEGIVERVDYICSSTQQIGMEIKKAVPFSSDVVNQTFPFRYRSPNNFILYAPIPRPLPFVENER